MQHYALFRLTSGMPCGCYPVTTRGAAMTLFSYKGGIKIAASMGDILRPNVILNGAKIKSFP